MKSVPLRRLCRILNGGTPKADTDNWGGEVPWATPVDLRKVDGGHIERTDRSLTETGLQAGSTLAPADSVLLSSRAPIGYTAITGKPMAFNQGCKALVPASGTDPRFLQYALMSVARNLKEAGSGSTFMEVGAEAIGATHVSAQRPEDQRRIADFLDDRVSRIDRIIAARQSQLERAPQAFKLRLSLHYESGPSIPLKSLARNITSGPRGWGDRVREAGTPFVRIANLRPLGIRPDMSDLVHVDTPANAETERTRLEAGDVLLSITAAFGEVAVWPGGEGAFSQHVARIRLQDPKSAEWLAWALQSQWLHDQYRLAAYGGTKVGMSLGQVGGLQVPAVTPDRRAEVARALGELWGSHAELQAALRRSIELLTEYKQSLITAAVTGQLDVTTASTRIPE